MKFEKYYEKLITVYEKALLIISLIFFNSQFNLKNIILTKYYTIFIAFHMTSKLLFYNYWFDSGFH